MTSFIKKTTKTPTKSSSTPTHSHPAQHTHRLILLFSFLFLLLFSLFFTSCQCGVETEEIPPPPKVTSSYPKNKATDIPVPVSFEMFLDFDKAIQFNPNSSSDITLVATTDTDSTNEDSRQFDSKDSRLSVQGKKLTLQLTNILLAGTEYTFTLPQDFLLEDNDIGNKKHSLTFTTADKIILDISLLSINTTNWYETESTDDGSFNQVITLTYPIIPSGVSNNDSLTGFFDTDLTDQIGTPASPVTISNLPNGLKLRISKQANGSQLRLTGNATSHAKKTDNTSFSLTLHDDFFDVDTADNIHFDFEVIFGSLWEGRRSHQAFVHDDKFWVLGGITFGPVGQNDIWTSDDRGTNWIKVAVNGPQWSTRNRHQALVYDDKIWVLGGYLMGQFIDRDNEIWSSDDGGMNWSQITPTSSHWTGRAEHQAFVYKDKLWVLGGYVQTDSIWNTDDEGTNWSAITIENSDWNIIYNHRAFAYDDKLWVLGGISLGGKDGIWYSEDDATNWVTVTVTGNQWVGRESHQAFGYDNKLWVLGGISSSGGVFTSHNDIWNSTNGGTNWTEIDVEGTHWVGRYSHQAFAYDDKLWILGGVEAGTGKPYLNDTWYSADGGTNWQEIATEYY